MHSLNASAVDDEGALKLYSRASLFDDHILADHFMDRASHTPPHLLSLEILREMPAQALSKLVSRLQV